jgi:hypothetical protein
MTLSGSSPEKRRTKTKCKNHRFKIYSLEDIMRIRRFSKPLTISLHPEAFDRIKEITDTEARSMADWIREAVDEALRRQETDLVDVAKQPNRNGEK